MWMQRETIQSLHLKKKIQQRAKPDQMQPQINC